jgi:hypothetical protein
MAEKNENENLERYMSAQGFTEEQKKAAREKLAADGELTLGSSQFLSEPKVVKPKKEA